MPHEPLEPSHGHLRAGRSRASVAGVAWNLVNVLMGTGLSTLVFVVASRVLSPGDFGVVALALSLVMLVSCLVPLGFGEALVQRAEVTPDHLDAVFWLCGAAGLALYAVVVLGAPLLAGLAQAPAVAPVLPLVGLRLPFDALAAVPAALLARRMNYRAFALRTALANGLGAAVCLAMVWAGFGFWALAASQVVSSAATLAVVTAVSGWRPRPRLGASALRDLRAFGLAATGTRAISEMRLDQILLGALAGPAVLGLYFFARRLFQMLNDLSVGVFSPVTGVLFASMQGEPEKARQAFLAAGFAAMLVGLPMFGGLIVVADTAVPVVFGAQWADAVVAVRGMSAIGLMAVVGIVQASLINGRGHAGWWLAYQGTSQLLSAPIVLVAYPLGGLDAVMAALVLRTLLLWPLSVRKTLRLLDLPLRAYLGSLWGPAAATLAMAAAVEAVPWAWPGLDGAARLGVEIGVGAAAYVVAAVLLAGGRIRALVDGARRSRGRTA